MKKNLLLSLLLIIGLFSASLACGITFAGTGNNTNNGDNTEALKLQLTLQALQMTQAVSSQNQQQQSSQQQQQGQTSQQQSSSGNQNTQTDSGPTPTVDNGIPCNSSKFVSETIPDFTNYQPGATFSKTWTLRNAGDCDWTEDYKFEFEEGSRMGGESVIPVNTVIEPNETITFKVNLKAPDTAGDYVGVWRLKAADGEKLGKYWVKIKVGGGAPPAGDFAVTSVQLSLDSGADPKVIANITAGAAGIVTYKWQDNGGVEKSGSVEFNAAGTKSISTAVVLGSGGWVKLYIDSPNHQWFGPINVP